MESSSRDFSEGLKALMRLSSPSPGVDLVWGGPAGSVA